jgi:hypothetical protein
MRVHGPVDDLQTRVGSQVGRVETRESKSPEALIEEARQHQRRRRMCTLVAVLAVVLGVIAGLTFTGGSGGPRPRAVTSTKPGAKHPSAPITKGSVPSVTSDQCAGKPQLYFANANGVWLLTDTGAIASTIDGGHQWTTFYGGPDCILSFDFLDLKNVWVLAAQASSPMVLHTSNGGRTWTSAPEPNGTTLASIDFVSPTSGWAVTTTGHLMQSLNGGENWQPVAAPANVATLCGDSDGTWLGLNNGEIVSQPTGASSWTQSLVVSQVPKPIPTLTNVDQPPDLGCFGETVWVLYTFSCGAGSCWYQVERSLDSGARWVVATPTLSGDSYLALGGVTSPTDAWFTAGNLVEGDPHSLVVTADAGSTFYQSAIYPHSGSTPIKDYGIAFDSALRGWAIVSLITQDGHS